MLKGLRLNGFFRMGIIKQVQRGTITCGWTSEAGTLTIKKVVPQNTIIRKLGVTTDASASSLAGGAIHVRIFLTDETTLGAKVFLPESVNGSLTTVSVEAVEYYPGVIRVQRDTVVSTGTTTTKSISPVVLGKTSLESLGYEFQGGSPLAFNAIGLVTQYSRIELTAANQVTLTMGTGFTHDHEHGFQLVETLMHGLDS